MAGRRDGQGLHCRWGGSGAGERLRILVVWIPEGQQQHHCVSTDCFSPPPSYKEKPFNFPVTSCLFLDIHILYNLTVYFQH